MTSGGSAHGDVVRVSCNTRVELFVGALHLRMVALDVLAREPEELLVVVGFEMVAAGALDRSHQVLLSGLYAFTVVPWAPNLTAFRRVPSNLERA